MAQEDASRTKDSIKKIEVSLQKAGKKFDSVKELCESLSSTLDEILALEKKIEENPANNIAAKEGIEKQKILSLYKKNYSALSSLQHSLKEFEEKAMRANLFLENYRNYREYSFSNSSSANKFVAEIFSTFSIASMQFKPEFVGTIDLESIAKELDLKKTQKQSLLVSSAQIKSLLEYLEKKQLLKSAKLENELLRVSIKGENKIRVEADNAKVRRIDRLSGQFDGTRLEE